MTSAGSQCALVLCIAALPFGTTTAQFVDEFDGTVLAGWTFFTGDGEAVMDLQPGESFASIHVDARSDEHNVWWALVKREVSGALDLNRLSTPGYELRIEARVRPSHAPRRINLHLNTQRTVDFHSHLMEFDLPDTTGWHTISMTTEGFDGRPGDSVRAQLALMDWGRGRYRLDVDYLKVDVVDAGRAGPDVGEPLSYRPPVPPVEAMTHHLAASQFATIDLVRPEVISDAKSGAPVLRVDSSHYVIMRWDVSGYAGRKASGPGVLELSTHSVERSGLVYDEPGQIRIVEILAGDPSWLGESVTLDGWTGGRPLDEVVNGQMIIDVEIPERRGESTFATISRPVMQRLLDGETRGILLRPLGSIAAQFYPIVGDGNTRTPRLHFEVLPDD